MATECLSNAVKAYSEIEEFRSLRELAFQTIIRRAQDYFPMKISEIDPSLFDFKTVISKSKFNCMIYMLHVFGQVINTPETLQVSFLSYIDKLFATIINAAAHPLLHAGVYRALSLLKKTKRNRLRIERIYRKGINRAIDYSQTVTKKGPTIYMLEQLNKLVSVWEPLPSDVYCLLNNASQKSEIESGYIKARRKFLSNQHDIEFSGLEEAKAIARKVAKMPYEFDEQASLMATNFKSTITTELKLGNNAPFDLINTSYQNMGETIPLQMKLKNNLSFTSAPQTIKTFLENQSHFQDYNFVIQVSDPEFFQVRPSFGKIAKDQSIPILITFNPNPLKSLGSIKGYFHIRLTNGLSLQR